MNASAIAKREVHEAEQEREIVGEGHREHGGRRNPAVHLVGHPEQAADGQRRDRQTTSFTAGFEPDQRRQQLDQQIDAEIADHLPVEAVILLEVGRGGEIELDPIAAHMAGQVEQWRDVGPEQRERRTAARAASTKSRRSQNARGAGREGRAVKGAVGPTGKVQVGSDFRQSGQTSTEMRRTAEMPAKRHIRRFPGAAFPSIGWSALRAKERDALPVARTSFGSCVVWAFALVLAFQFIGPDRDPRARRARPGRSCSGHVARPRFRQCLYGRPSRRRRAAHAIYDVHAYQLNQEPVSWRGARHNYS